MKTNLHHVSLFTNDPDRLLILFQELLGFKELWKVGPLGGKGMAALFGMDDVKAELIMLQSKEGDRLELIHLLEPRFESAQMPNASPASASLCLKVQDLEGLYQGVIQKGWEPFAPISKMPTPTGEMINMFCMRTEENILLEFIEEIAP